MIETLLKKFADQKNNKSSKDFDQSSFENYSIGKNLPSMNKFFFIIAVLSYLLSNELDNNYKESISKEIFILFEKMSSLPFSSQEVKTNFYFYYIDIIIIFFSLSSNFDLITNIEKIVLDYVDISIELDRHNNVINQAKEKIKETNDEKSLKKIILYYNCKILHLIMIVSLKSNKTSLNKKIKEFFIKESLRKSKFESNFISQNIDEYFTVFKEKQLGILFDYKFLEDHKDDLNKLYTVNSYQNIEKYINSLVFYMIKYCVDINQYESFLDSYLYQIKANHDNFTESDNKKIINLYFSIISTFSLEKTEKFLHSNFSINFLNEVNYAYYDIKSADELLKIYYDDEQEMLHEWLIVETQFRNVKILSLNNVEIINNVIKFQEILKSLIKTVTLNNEINLSFRKRNESSSFHKNENLEENSKNIVAEKINSNRKSNEKKESQNGQENLVEVDTDIDKIDHNLDRKMFYFNKESNIGKKSNNENELNKSTISDMNSENLLFKVIN